MHIVFFSDTQRLLNPPSSCGFAPGLEKCDSHDPTHVDRLSGFVMTHLLNTFFSLSFFFSKHFSNRNNKMTGTEPRKHQFYLPCIHVCTSQQSIFRRPFGGKVYFFYDSDLSFCITRTFGTKYKVRSCWGAWEGFFYARFSDEWCAGQ